MFPAIRNMEIMEEIKQLVKEFRISKTVLAKKVGIVEGTFKVKWNNHPLGYCFTDEEINKIRMVIKELGTRAVSTT